MKSNKVLVELICFILAMIPAQLSYGDNTNYPPAPLYSFAAIPLTNDEWVEGVLPNGVAILLIQGNGIYLWDGAQKSLFYSGDVYSPLYQSTDGYLFARAMLDKQPTIIRFSLNPLNKVPVDLRTIGATFPNGLPSEILGGSNATYFAYYDKSDIHVVNNGTEKKISTPTKALIDTATPLPPQYLGQNIIDYPVGVTPVGNIQYWVSSLSTEPPPGSYDRTIWTKIYTAINGNFSKQDAIKPPGEKYRGLLTSWQGDALFYIAYFYGIPSNTAYIRVVKVDDDGTEEGVFQDFTLLTAQNMSLNTGILGGNKLSALELMDNNSAGVVSIVDGSTAHTILRAYDNIGGGSLRSIYLNLITPGGTPGLPSGVIADDGTFIFQGEASSSQKMYIAFPR